jgi:hypothetical protein
VRIQVFNPKDEDEIALINKLQDQFIIKANGAEPPPEFEWDLESLKVLTAQYEKDSTQYSSWKGMMGRDLRGRALDGTFHQTDAPRVEAASSPLFETREPLAKVEPELSD